MQNNPRASHMGSQTGSQVGTSVRTTARMAPTALERKSAGPAPSIARATSRSGSPAPVNPNIIDPLATPSRKVSVTGGAPSSKAPSARYPSSRFASVAAVAVNETLTTSQTVDVAPSAVGLGLYATPSTASSFTKKVQSSPTGRKDKESPTASAFTQVIAIDSLQQGLNNTASASAPSLQHKTRKVSGIPLSPQAVNGPGNSDPGSEKSQNRTRRSNTNRVHADDGSQDFEKPSGVGGHAQGQGQARKPSGDMVAYVVTTPPAHFL